MSFFTLVDPEAPCIADRAVDKTWSTESRLAFARNAVQALTQLHSAGTDGEPIVHRNLTPRTMLVKHDNSPILTGFEHSRIPFEVSVASSSLPRGSEADSAAPEVRAQGLTVASHRSDIYSLSVSLSLLFEGREDHLTGCGKNQS
jgi:hypothetical protein